MNVMKSDRVEWIDSAKGFGIICVVLGHMAIPNSLRHLIFGFHMPLFFALSGFLYRNGIGLSWGCRKLQGLLIPYVINSIIVGVAVWIVGGPMTVDGMTRSFLRGNGVDVTWFFMCLLLANFVGALGLKVFRGNHLALVFVCILMGVLLVKTQLPMVCMSHTVFPAAAFWTIGNWLNVKGGARWVV